MQRIGLQHLPPIVFVTAYHEHAVRAFDVHAIDYLTKPVEAKRLQTGSTASRKRSRRRPLLLTHAQLARY